MPCTRPPWKFYVILYAVIVAFSAILVLLLYTPAHGADFPKQEPSQYTVRVASCESNSQAVTVNSSYAHIVGTHVYIPSLQYKGVVVGITPPQAEYDVNLSKCPRRAELTIQNRIMYVQP